MKDVVQAQYEQRLSRYAALVHGNEPPGLVAKLAIYAALLEQHTTWKDRLWRMEPLLYPLIQSAETDLHLSTARLLEAPRRSEQSLFKFLEYCLENRTQISWLAGERSADLLRAQLDRLESHRSTIDAIMARRDKYFAHIDKKYFRDPTAIYTDFPLMQSDAIALVNSVISIVAEHQRLSTGSMNIHLAEFYRISVDNMVRNLAAGRRINFPGQLDGPDPSPSEKGSQPD